MDGLELLLEKFENEISEIKDNMADGSAKSYEEYQKFCGMVKGLAIAINHVIDLQEANREGEYEDDD
jgi:hypothetical protein|tara:strand:- start:115 stop:315 length:201 start_codon:yes stop_codon:yes gene_type:complete